MTIDPATAESIAASYRRAGIALAEAIARINREAILAEEQQPVAA